MNFDITIAAIYIVRNPIDVATFNAPHICRRSIRSSS
jgi:hypothetical protein